MWISIKFQKEIYLIIISFILIFIKFDNNYVLFFKNKSENVQQLNIFLNENFWTLKKYLDNCKKEKFLIYLDNAYY